ncbi:MAG: nucleotidyltransferase domain-containing protein [Phormidesmis sp.]
MEHPQLQEILGKLKRHLELLYGDRLASLILFGSQARKEARADSDIDILIVLKGPLDAFTERKKLSLFLSQLCLEYNVVVTCIRREYQEWQTRQSPLLMNIRREGIAV